MIVARRHFGCLWLPRSLPGHERRRCRELLRRSPVPTNPVVPAVTYLCHAGLANRLRSHIIAAGYALRHQRSLYVHWPITDHFAARFTDLFEPLPSLPVTSSTIAFIARGEPLSALPSVPLVVLRTDWQYSEPGELDLHTTGCADVVRRSLRPRQTIMDEVERFATSVSWPAVGLHIRLGDFKNNGQALPIERFIAAVNAHDQQSGATLPLLLASDGTETELAPLFAAFPGRIVRRRGSANRIDQGALVDALVDLLLLSRCQHIIQTPRSSFGQVACFLGNCPGNPA